MDDLDFCRRRVAEYAATRGKPGFDQKKLYAMINGCAHRQELLRTDLPPAEERSYKNYSERSVPTFGVDPHAPLTCP